jgi:hypothetical protein
LFPIIVCLVAARVPESRFYIQYVGIQPCRTPIFPLLILREVNVHRPRPRACLPSTVSSVNARLCPPLPIFIFITITIISCSHAAIDSNSLLLLLLSSIWADWVTSLSLSRSLPSLLLAAPAFCLLSRFDLIRLLSVNSLFSLAAPARPCVCV